MSLIRAARGLEPVDLLLRDGRLANVLTGEIYPADVAIYQGRIAAVEPPGTMPAREARRLIEAEGRLLVPGLIDSHMHIESSLVTPAPFAEAALRRGTTTVAEDPHEIANAAGLPGVRAYYEASRDLPLDILFLASTCVPAAAGLEHCRGHLGAPEITEMLTWPGVIGLAEVMDARRVIDEEPGMAAILAAGREAGGIIEGHNPMLAGRELAAYVAAGVHSDHTLATPERLLAKLRLGVTIQLQERYMSEAVIAAISALPTPPPTLSLVTDDVAPDYLMERGHLDQVLRRAIALGLPPMRALQAATINPARHLRLYDRGAVAPGLRADLLLVDGLESFEPHTVVAGGELVVEAGQSRWSAPPQPPLDGMRDSLDLSPVDADTFRPGLPIDEGELTVRAIRSHPHGTTTEPAEITLRLAAGEPQLAQHPDTCLISVIARGGGSRSTGFVVGLGLERGAIATSHAHDSHNLAVIGRDRASMVTAANAVIGSEGGIAVAEGERLLAHLPLPIAGVVSDRPVAEVAAAWRQITTTLDGLGLRHPYLLMRLTTFTLPVSSGLRITDRGYVLAEERRVVGLVV